MGLVGNTRGIRTFCDLVKREAPNVMFLQKMKLEASIIELKKFTIGLKIVVLLIVWVRVGVCRDPNLVGLIRFIRPL